MPPNWITCQIGARENYSLARALQAQGALARLVTDLWCPPHWPPSLRSRLGRVGERSHPDLPAPRVWAPMGAALVRELGDKLTRRTGWDQILHRNAWFQRSAAAYLAQVPQMPPQMTVFAYSYAAGDILHVARKRGWKTILGQIDPGPVEARMVTQLYRDAGQSGEHTPIPEIYWDHWRRETELADLILVNSAWSAEGLQAEGIPREKIRILPLAYEGGRHGIARPAVAAFSPARPLRLLFLGQVTLRKGADLVLEAMRLCPDLPLRLDIVGPLQIALPNWVGQDPRITLHGSVPRSRVEDFYAQADLFMFPTRSDGFGLTQLEALRAGVPILASRHCGEVVRPGTDGIVLDDLNAKAVAATLTLLLEDPGRLTALQQGTCTAPNFGLERLGTGLMALETELHGTGGAP